MNSTVIFRALCASNPSFPSHLATLSVGVLANYIPDHSCLIFHGSTNILHLRTPPVAFCIMNLLFVSFSYLCYVSHLGPCP